MNTNDYLNKLLGLCNEGQLNLFNKMYPDGPDKKQLSWAISQVERTLKSENDKITNLKNEIKELKTIGDKKTDTIHSLNSDIADLQKELNALKNYASASTDDVQKQLDKLQALEAGGVDNWEWYDESLDSWRIQYS